MNKLAALSKLASAYHYIVKSNAHNTETLLILNDAFGYVRRSLRMEELAPKTEAVMPIAGVVTPLSSEAINKLMTTPVAVPMEVLNPPGPRFF
jgi:hypothetical protein